MNSNKNLILILIVGTMISIILAFGLSTSPSPPGLGKHLGMFRDLQNLIKIKIFISTLNIILIGALLWNYTKIYKNMPNKFTLSLIIFSISLLLYAISSNPLIHVILGFRGGPGLGPFTFLPDLFATAAIITLLHQTLK